jgi:hypothetical protein
VTDLFAFTSPDNPAHTVLSLNVFCSAGITAAFSNAVNYSIVVRRMTVAGLGNAAKFKPGDKEYRFNTRFSVLEAGTSSKTVQRGTLTCPDGQTLHFVVGDENGTSTPDGTFRVFAGLRSDPFFLAWIVEETKPFPNLLEHDNVLAIVIEFDTRRVLDPTQGSLFGVIGETSAIPGAAGPIGHEPPRFDWVGRPEQTNMRLNNNGLKGTDDLRDLWNQQTPFAMPEELQPLFRKRLKDSLTNWDMRDGKADWPADALDAVVSVYLDDFILFDVSKPTSDTSYLEIEKSTLRGHPYQTGGGRTVNSNVIDIMITWMVNNDREALHGGSKGATQPGRPTFPYQAPPNMQLQTVANAADVSASPDQVWALIGQFGGMWHPLIASIQLTGEGIGQLRTIETIDGKQIIERLEALDNSQKSYRYTNVSGIGAVDYTGTLVVKAKGSGSSVEWRVQYLANGQPDFIVKTIVSTLLKAGLEGLQKRFGAAKS